MYLRQTASKPNSAASTSWNPRCRATRTSPTWRRTSSTGRASMTTKLWSPPCPRTCPTTWWHCLHRASDTSMWSTFLSHRRRKKLCEKDHYCLLSKLLTYHNLRDTSPVADVKPFQQSQKSVKFHDSTSNDKMVKALSNAKIPQAKEPELNTMKIEDLHALQEELAKKLELTNSLLQSKLSASKPHFESVSSRALERSSSTKKHSIYQLGASKKAELIQKAQLEYKEYMSNSDYDSSTTPMPSRKLPPAPTQNDQILSQKMEMFREIQSRVKGTTNDQENRNPNLRSLISPPQQHPSILQYSLKSSQHPLTTSAEQNLNDSDDDLVYSLNQKSSLRLTNNQLQSTTHYQHQLGSTNGSIYMPSQGSFYNQQNQQQISQQQYQTGPPQYMQPQFMTVAQQQPPKIYDESLFNIIDEIENEQTYKAVQGAKQSYGMQQQEQRMPHQQYVQERAQFKLSGTTQGYGQQQNDSSFISQVNQSTSSYKSNPYYLQAKITHFKLIKCSVQADDDAKQQHRSLDPKFTQDEMILLYTTSLISAMVVSRVISTLASQISTNLQVTQLALHQV